MGNIDIAIVNRWIIGGHFIPPDWPPEDEETTEERIARMKRINVKNQLEYLDNYLYDFDRYGHMYGVAELETQSKTLYNSLHVLQTTGFDTETGDIFDEKAYEKYQKYLKGYTSCERALTARRLEYNQAVAQRDSI